MADENKTDSFDPFVNLSDEQKDKFKEFKASFFEQTEELSDEEQAFLTDMCLLRYLRARDWNLTTAGEMLRNSLQWRFKDYLPHTITAADIESESESGKMYPAYTFDKAGRPIVYMKPRYDNSTDRVIKLKYLVWTMEQAISMIKDSEKTGVEKLCLIIDFQGTGMRQSSVGNIQVSMDCLNVLQNQYPERLGVAYMMNAPWVFTAFWKCVSPFIAEETMKKIVFIANKNGYEQILDVIDKDVLETDYGGDNDFKYDHAVWRKKWFEEPEKKKKKKKKKTKKTKKAENKD
eukprot:TRINITY_DN846_c0_g1_i1.p1 TRINITY_DN846_c0_g1~~TRINITY_DN846_c0_g1_i1.p1  ORF type:complete len:290 (-),score=73.20 TRINITY_DN846_c0_g1_i1:54-923(-)